MLSKYAMVPWIDEIGEVDLILIHAERVLPSCTLTEEEVVKKGSLIDEAVPAPPDPKGEPVVLKGTVLPSAVSFQMKLEQGTVPRPG